MKLLESEGELAVALIETEEGLGLQEKRPVVSDVVDNAQVVFVGRESEFSTELLHPQNAGVGGAEHYDGVEGGEVDALVEDIDGEDHVEVAVAQLFERAGSGRARQTGVVRCGRMRRGRFVVG